MFEFKLACKKALQYLKKKNGNKGIDEIAELPDRWIFFGYGGGPYGNTPVTVNKESGEIESFSLALVENQDLYYDNSSDVEVPIEFG